MKVDELKHHLKSGGVYRRADLQRWSTSVDRHLRQLVECGVLEKLAGGLYYVPTQSVFGKLPAIEENLVKTFLKDGHFIVVSSNDYNSLGVGTTQLYNERRVYNQKRHGVFKLGNRNFRFIRKPFVPNKVSQEFLLVDLVNNLNQLEENQPLILANVQSKARQLNKKKLLQIVNAFGTIGTKKKFYNWLED